MADSDSFSKGLMSQCILSPMCHELLDNHFFLALDVDARGFRVFDAAALQVDEVVG